MRLQKLLHKIREIYLEYLYMHISNIALKNTYVSFIINFIFYYRYKYLFLLLINFIFPVCNKSIDKREHLV